jgi:hypothetical protein
MSTLKFYCNTEIRNLHKHRIKKHSATLFLASPLDLLGADVLDTLGPDPLHGCRLRAWEPSGDDGISDANAGILAHEGHQLLVLLRRSRLPRLLDRRLRLRVERPVGEEPERSVRVLFGGVCLGSTLQAVCDGLIQVFSAPASRRGLSHSEGSSNLGVWHSAVDQANGLCLLFSRQSPLALGSQWWKA